jgi:hypothetical protein
MSEEKKEDFLDTDPPINGQNFACLSFVSPEQLIKKKEGYNVAKFLQSYSKDKGMEFKEVYEDYENYCYKFNEDLQRDFDKENKYQTSVRGVKIRGVYSTKEEAERRAQKLQRMDDTFHVFVGDVGAWLPWDPCADNVESEVFADSALQDLMSKYKENNVSKDIFYEEDKRDRMKKAQEDNLKKEKENELAISENVTIPEEHISEPISEEKQPCDDCPEKKCPECPIKSSELSSCSVEPEPEPEPESESDLVNNTVDESIKSSLEEADPWLKNKTEKTD